VAILLHEWLIPTSTNQCGQNTGHDIQCECGTCIHPQHDYIML